MTGLFGRDVQADSIAPSGEIKTGKERLARAQQDRRQRQVELVHEPFAQILTDGLNAAA